MVQSRSAPCKKGDELKDYEDIAKLQEAILACAAILRGSNPSSSDRLPAFVQAPAASVITGEVVVNEKVKHDAVPLSAGVIAVVCVSAIAILLICLCTTEIMNSLFWSRRRHNTSILNRQDVHDDHSRAAAEGPVEVADSNPSANGSSEVASSIAGLNDSQVAASKQGLAHWVIKGLPIVKYKKQQVHRNSGVMIAPAELDHDIESEPLAQPICNGTAPDYKRLECVVCLSPFEEDEDVRVLPRCCHAFHAACIDSWLLLHSTCPLCRVQISSLDVERDAEPAAASYAIACNTT